MSKNKNSKFDWSNFVSLIVGAAIPLIASFINNHHQNSQLEKNYENQMQQIEVQFDNQLKQEAIADKKETATNIILSLYSLQQMRDGLIEENPEGFLEDSYTLIAVGRLQFTEEVINLYQTAVNQAVLEDTYNGDLIDNKLIPTLIEEVGMPY